MSAPLRPAGLGALTDAHRALVGAVRAVAADPAPAAVADPAPAAVAAPSPAAVAALCDAIRRHLTAEDDVVWPLLERRAGAAVELAGLLDDHRALHDLLDRAVADPRPATLAELRDVFEEHVAEEERTVFPAALRYLSAEEITTVATALRDAQRTG